MAWYGSRRVWRRIYRRSRVYIPIILLLLLAMAVMLPLSAPWMARKAEKEIWKATGLPVSIERVRVQLWSGEAILFGLEVGGGNAPFRIGQIRARGALSELIANDGFWPEEVVITSPSELQLVQTDKGIEPRGELKTIIDAVTKAVPSASNGSSHAGGRAGGRLPRILIQNAAVRLEMASAEQPPLRVHLDSINFPGHEGRGASYEAEFAGFAELEHSEEIRGNVRYGAADQNLHVQASVGGLSGKIDVPGFGSVRAEGDDVRFSADTSRNADGSMGVRIEVEPARFEAFEMREGGERWADDRLRLYLDGKVTKENDALEGVMVRLVGSEVDARLEGSMSLGQGLKTDARLWVTRLPPAFYVLARREAAREGVYVEALTSDTLRLDLAASGPLIHPTQMTLGGTVAISNLRLREPSLPRPLEIRRIEGSLTSDSIDLPVVEAEYGDLTLKGHAVLPLLLNDGDSGTATVDCTVEGTGSSLLEIARGRGFLPAEIRDAALPFTLTAKASTPAVNRKGVVHVDEEHMVYSGVLSWREGEVAYRGIPTNIDIGAGQVAFDNSQARFSHLNLLWRDVTIDADVSLTRPAGGWRGMPAYQLSANVGGPVPRLLELASYITYLPVAPTFAVGTMQLSAEVSGVWGEWAGTQYTLSAGLLDGSTTINVPHPLLLDQLFIEATATRDGIELRRLQGRVGELATVQGSGNISAEEAKVDFSVDAALAVAEKVDPFDVDEVVFRGHATGKGTARLIARQPLAEGPDVPRRWIAALAGPGGPKIGVTEDSPLQFDLTGHLVPGEDAAAFQRDFPHEITNIRGDVEVDERGFIFHNVKTKWGAADNVTIDGRMTFGINDGPFEIDADVHVPEIDINEWMTGWGEREWAGRPYIGVRPGRGPGSPEKKLAVITARLKIDRTRFMSVRAQNVDANFLFEAWRHQNARVKATINEASVYGGKISGTADLKLKQGNTDQHTYMVTQLTASSVQMQTFLTDLREQPEEFVGLFNGSAAFEGSIGNYDDWAGEGDYHVEESRFIGDQAFHTISNWLSAGREKYQTPTTLRGHAYMSDREIRFPDMVVQNRDIRIVTAGTVFFNGDIDFLATVEVLTNRLDDVPVISNFIDYFNTVKNMFVSLHITGKIRQPIVKRETITPEQLKPLQMGRRVLKKTEETLRSGEKAIERGVESLPKLPGTSSSGSAEEQKPAP